MSPVTPREDRVLDTFTAIEKLRLVAEIVVSFARVRRRMRGEANVAALVATVRRGVPRQPPDAGEAIWLGRRMGAIVSRVAGHVPGDTRCLARSLVLVDLLARRGVGTTLVIGVRAAPAFGAHAWVELGGNPLLEPIEEGGSRLTEL
jgi:hypothetical protein